MSTSSLLSPLAKPFRPTSIFLNNEQSFHYSVYDGTTPPFHPIDLPQVDLDTDRIEGMSDEAMDNHFPPTFEELTELEEVDFFVLMLAHLDLMESYEEQSREFLDKTKQWSTQKEDSKEEETKEEEAKNNKQHDQEKSSRYHQRHDHGWLDLNKHTEMLPKKERKYRRNRPEDVATKNRTNDHSKCNIVKNSQHKRPIQQPRKRNY